MTTPATSRLFTRRRFLQTLGALSLSLGGTVGYMRALEPQWLTTKQIDLFIQGLPAHLDGRRLAHLTDLHLSQYMSPGQLRGAVRLVQELAPDWLFLTGDYVGDLALAAAGLPEAFQDLTVPAYATFGNHDYWTHQPTVARYLIDAGITPLRNEAAEIDDGLWVAGVDDVWSGRPDLRTALNPIPHAATTILLVHEPDFFDTVLSQDAPVALQLSGHSHGGQVRFPTLTPDDAGNYSHAPILPRYGRRYPMGLRAIAQRHVYTNVGVGVWPVPYRLNCRPELAVITLRAA